MVEEKQIDTNIRVYEMHALALYEILLREPLFDIKREKIDYGASYPLVSTIKV